MTGCLQRICCFLRKQEEKGTRVGWPWVMDGPNYISDSNIFIKMRDLTSSLLIPKLTKIVFLIPILAFILNWTNLELMVRYLRRILVSVLREKNLTLQNKLTHHRTSIVNRSSQARYVQPLVFHVFIWYFFQHICQECVKIFSCQN